IDGTNIRNRSHAFEKLSSIALSLTGEKYAVILIGGKSAIKAIPAAQDFLKKLRENGFEKVYIAVGQMADKIKEKIGDGSQYNLTLEYFTDGEGTGGALLPFKKFFNSSFLVYNSSEIFKGHIEKLTEFHKKHHAIATTYLNNYENMSGLYIFEPEIFKYIPKGFSMLEEDIFPKLNEKGDLINYIAL
ncbi:MAG: sugar phosphate nucleotidyltransferase, partial [bacterium]